MMELSIVVPTYNEKPNISKLVENLEVVLENISWEIIFVDDDSPDKTAEEVRLVARINSKVRILHRLDRSGLSSACTEGVMSSSAQFVVIMDADLQHDERIIPEMLCAIKNENYNLVVGSRFVDGASASNGLSKIREKGSNFAIWMSQFLLKPIQLNDSMSGFFMFEREVFAKHAKSFSKKGFKILLDFVICAKKDIRLKEIGYEMRAREFGESKMGHTVILDYVQLLLEHSMGKVFPVRYILFVLVGASGLLLHLVILFIFYEILSYSFYTSQLIATVIAMTSNYFMNNASTYRDKMLGGRQLLYRLFSFYTICGIGAWVNLTISFDLVDSNVPWVIAGLIGAAISSVWNYSVSSILTWR